MNRAAVFVLALAGCGRLRFDDAPSSGDAATDMAPPCPMTFCDDFERTGDPTDGWDAPLITGAPTAALSNGRLVVTIPNDGDRFFLTKTLPAPTTMIELGVRMTYSTADSGTDCELDLVALNWAMACNTSFGFYLVRDGTGPINLQETNGAPGCTQNRNNEYTMNFDNTGPHEYRMRVTIGTGSRVSWDVDTDLNFVDRTTAGAVPSSTITLRVGAVGVRNLAAPWTITYEDLYVNVQ